MRLPSFLLVLALSFPAVARAECEPEVRADAVSELKSALFTIGAHVLQVVDHSPSYPKDDATRAKENARIAKEIAKKPFGEMEKTVLADLRATGADDVDLFHGSHVVVDDGGLLYEKWIALGARPRTSSHYKDVATPQYEIELPRTGVLLFGKTAAGETWFQTEAHADKRGVDWVLHRLDYVKHKGLGFVNVGPMGISPHSEKTGAEIRL